jgi:hypothetical protein
MGGGMSNLTKMYPPGTKLLHFRGMVMHNAMEQAVVDQDVTVVEECFSTDTLWISYMRNGEEHHGYVIEDYAVSFVEAEGGLK